MERHIERTRDGMNAVIERGRHAVVDGADRAERGVESVAERVVTSAHETHDHFRDSAEAASREAHRGVNQAARTLDRGYREVKSDLSRLVATASDLLATHPGKSILAAAAVGFVLGLAVRRRAPG